MQATDLLLGLMTDKRLVSQDPFPQKADSSQTYRDSFQAMFDKAISRPTQKTDFNNLASNSQDDKNASASNTTKATTHSANQAKNDDQNGPTVFQQMNAARLERRQAAKTDATQSTTSQAIADRQANGQGVQGLDDQNTNDKMSALIDRIQEEIDKGKDQTDAQMVQLLLQLIAMLLAAAQNSVGETANAADTSNGTDGSSNLNMALTLDPDSKLSKILDILLNGQDGLTDQDLKDINILLKLTGDKGLLIPLSELVKGNGEDQTNAGDSAKITLQLTDQTDASKTVELNLTIDAADVKAAKLVNLSDPALKQTDIAMIIPLEKLTADAQAKAELQQMLDALAQKGLQNDVISALSQEEAAKAAEEADALAQAKIVVPLKSTETVKSVAESIANTVNTAEAPKVETADPMLFNSEKYLKAIQVENLAKEMTSGGTDKREIFDRLQKLLFANDPNAMTLDKILVNKKDSSMSFLKEWTQNFAGQTKQDTHEWMANLSKDLGTQQASNAQADNISSERVVFLGRSEAANDLSQIIAEKTVNTSGTTQGQNLKESVMQQIIQRASYVFQNGAQGEVRIFLRPENLGDLNLKVKIDQDVVTAKFTATSNEVKAIIENNLGQLKNALEQMGIKVSKFEVNVSNGSNQQAQQGQQEGQGDSYNAGQGYSASEAVGTYGSSMDFDYENAALYGSDGSVNAGNGRVNYFA
jgi:flagellar hook-length control protein FliK